MNETATVKKSSFIPLIVLSIGILLNVFFVPMFDVWGGLIPSNADNTFADVFKNLFEGTDFRMWVEIFTWSAFVPAVVLLISSIAKGKVMSILSSAGGTGFLLFNLFRFISQNELSDVFGSDCNISIGFWIALILFVASFFYSISIKKKAVANSTIQHSSGGQMGGIPTFNFNGKEYLTIDDENHYIGLANKGITSAQHGLGLFYIQKNDIEKALYWFCVAEYNGEEQAVSDLNYIASTHPNPEWLNQRIAHYRNEVSQNPVYKETLDDIFREMAQDPNLRK